MVRPRGMYFIGPDTFQAKKEYTQIIIRGNIDRQSWCTILVHTYRCLRTGNDIRQGNCNESKE